MAVTMMNMTEARVRDAGPGEYLDEKGKVLRLYVTEKGVRSFGVYVWSPAKKYAVRRSLGKWSPALTVDMAREKAAEEEKKILAGEVKKPPEPPKESTLKALIDAYSLRLKANGAREPRWMEKALKRSFGEWMNRPLSAFRKADIEKRYVEIANDPDRGPTAAVKAVRALRTVFNYAIDSEDEIYAGKNTAKMVKLPKSEPRQRVLSAEETRKILEALDWEGFYPWVKPYFRLLMLTGVRKTNLASARWDEFDLDRGVWVVPASKAKSKRNMEIILRPEAVEILQRRIGVHPELVFPSRYERTEGGHIKDAAATWKRVLAHAGITSRITIHDIRRSYGSLLVNAGVPISVVAKAMGHVDVKTTIRHYSVVESATVRSALESVAAFQIPEPTAPPPVAPKARKQPRAAAFV